MDELTIASRLVHFTAVSLLFGAALFRVAIWRGATDQPPAAEFDAWTRGLSRVAAPAALLSALGWLAAAAVEMTGSRAVLADPQTLAAVLLDTRFGRIWLWRLAATVALIAVLVAAPRLAAPRRHRLELALSGILAASLVGFGHATIGKGLLGGVHAVADALHLLSAAAWLGGLACLGFLLRRAVRPGGADRAAVLATAIPRFSRMGYVAVALLLISGCINSLMLIADPAALLHTRYGQVLLTKLGLVGVMLAGAALNRFVLAPRVLAGNSANVTDLWHSVMVEQVVAGLVLVSVAVLGTIHPVI